MTDITPQSYPHATVACVVEKEGKFLLVKEVPNGETVLNQPAGHIEPNERIIDAAIRETYEETGWKVKPTYFLGLSQYLAPGNGVTYIRHSFIAEAQSFDAEAILDEGIIEAVWMSYEEILANKHALRSPLVLDDINRFRAGEKYDIRILGAFTRG